MIASLDTIVGTHMVQGALGTCVLFGCASLSFVRFLMHLETALFIVWLGASGRYILGCGAMRYAFSSKRVISARSLH